MKYLVLREWLGCSCRLEGGKSTVESRQLTIAHRANGKSSSQHADVNSIEFYVLDIITDRSRYGLFVFGQELGSMCSDCRNHRARLLARLTALTALPASAIFCTAVHRMHFASLHCIASFRLPMYHLSLPATRHSGSQPDLPYPRSLLWESQSVIRSRTMNTCFLHELIAEWMRNRQELDIDGNNPCFYLLDQESVRENSWGYLRPEYLLSVCKHRESIELTCVWQSSNENFPHGRTTACRSIIKRYFIGWNEFSAH